MTEKFWDKSAEKYSKSKIADEESYQKKLTETQSYFNPDMRVIEFGCGTGSTAIQHAPHVKHIDAIDISGNMIEIAQSKASKAGIENINFTKGILTDLNATDASIDVVLGLSILHLLPDHQNTINEVARILKPGGIFVSSTACLGNSPFRFIKYVAPLAKKLNLMPDVFIFTEERLATQIKTAGFKIESQWSHGMTVFIIGKKH